MEKVKDNVNHPAHYENSCSLECIDVMELIFGTEFVLNFSLGNAFKYLWRYRNKNGTEDLKKSEWYLNKAKDLSGVIRSGTTKESYSDRIDRLERLFKKTIRKEEEKNAEKRDEVRASELPTVSH